MFNSSYKPGVLIVNTSKGVNLIGESEKNLITLLGPSFEVRVVSALDDLSQITVNEIGVIFNGSPYSVYDDFKWIDNYRDFVKKMIDKDKVILGICFGLHIMADVLGGTVKKAELAQVGYEEVFLSNQGMNSALFSDLPKTPKFATFHFDHIINITQYIPHLR